MNEFGFEGGCVVPVVQPDDGDVFDCESAESAIVRATLSVALRPTRSDAIRARFGALGVMMGVLTVQEAAARMRVTQYTITRMVKTLRRELNVALKVEDLPFKYRPVSEGDDF